VGGSGAYFQPTLGMGEGSLLLAASQKGTGGVSGLIAHENAIFAAEFATYTGAPLTPDDRIRAWDATSIMLDGQSAGGWMPEEMIHDPIFVKGKAHLIAWPVFPQFPAQMMVQALVVTDLTPSDNPTEPGGIPTAQAVASGPVTITVRDATPQHTVVFMKTLDLSDTVEIGGYTPNLQTALSQGTYTVFANATISGTPLEAKFVIANIPSDKTSVGTNDLSFPGQYLVAVDSAGNANGGSLTVTRGSVVPLTTSIPGFAIVKPDSTGAFDVIGPSGTKHTYTAPTPWARFIPVE